MPEQELLFQNGEYIYSYLVLLTKLH